MATWLGHSNPVQLLFNWCFLQMSLFLGRGLSVVKPETFPHSWRRPSRTAVPSIGFLCAKASGSSYCAQSKPKVPSPGFKAIHRSSPNYLPNSSSTVSQPRPLPSRPTCFCPSSMPTSIPSCLFKRTGIRPLCQRPSPPSSALHTSYKSWQRSHLITNPFLVHRRPEVELPLHLPNKPGGACLSTASCVIWA